MKLVWLIPLAFLFIPILGTPSYAWQHDLEARSELFIDNDQTHSLTLDEVFHIKNETTKLGVGITQTFIDESGRSRSYYGGLLEGDKKFGNIDVNGKLKLINWDGSFRVPISLNSSQDCGALRFEENFDSGTIDSVKAYDEHIYFRSIGGTVDYSILDDLTITGGYWHRWSSDENERDLYLGRLIYSFTDNFHAQYRYKGIRNEEKVPGYFSPETFDQHTLLFGYFDSFLDRVKLKIWAGPVYQDDGNDKTIGALEDARVTWRITDVWLIEGRIEANQVGSGYQYVYSALSISYDF